MTADRPFGLPDDLITTVIDIPLPPSVNRTRRIDWRNKSSHERWLDDAGKLIMVKGKRHMIKGKFEATIVLSERTKLDLDNSIKSLLDLAVGMGLVKDDGPKHMRRLIVEFGEAPVGVKMTLRELCS